MNTLFIVLLDPGDGKWVARVSNTEIEYPFRYLASDPDVGTQCVRELAMAMQAGEDQVIKRITERKIFDLEASDDAPEEMVGQLFNATDAISLGEDSIPFFAPEVALSGVLEDAGTALLAVIP